ncbi:MAG: GNAT family N-acetyltransferase [Saprospiraceae bacterium]|nr:GNAT family N-acetyltransferase [Lewinella sp.]
MQIKNLADTPFPDLIHTFNTAFADYIVPMQVEQEAMRLRWLSCRADYRLSFGAFDDDQLVGFMVTGVDEWKGLKTAYNAGTGVIPSHRGRHIVQQLYDKAIPAFKTAGIRQCTLEVIVGNDRAIKAYERVGFRKDRTLKCFGKANFLPTRERRKWHFREAETPDWNTYREFREFPPSWENNRQAVAIAGEHYTCKELYEGEDLIGFILFRPESAYVAQFGVADWEDWLHIGHQLWQHVLRIHSGMRINNIEAEAGRSIAILEQTGLQNTIDQYEMSFRLAGE